LTVVLRGGLLIDPARATAAQGDIAITDGRVGSALTAHEGPPGAPALHDRQTIDVSGCVVMPGHACAHHHLYSTLARGMPLPLEAPRNFVEILERVWWRLDRALDLDTIELSGLVGAMEAAKAGTTTIVDHHASPEAIDSSLDAVADALLQTGMRGVVCYEVTDRHGESRGRAGTEENARFLRANKRELVRGMVGAHASFTVGTKTMGGLVAVARDHDVPIHIHVAEDVCDQRDSLERYGVRVVQRLTEAGALGEGDLLAHGVHLDDGEIETVRSSDAWVAHNPRSNMNNGVGYAPVLELGERVTLGTDGIDGDMFAEARSCFLKAREASLDVEPSFAAGRLAAGSCMAGSLFDEPNLGTLEDGAPADLVVLDYGPPTPLDHSNFDGHLVFGMSSASVRDVMVAGRWVVRNREHVLVDEAEVVARSQQAARKLWTRMQEL
jgi:putative selenium metabolism protein SsnA